MRPNIQISHALNGRVKDYAAANDLSTPEAYEQIIEAGLNELRGTGGHQDTKTVAHDSQPDNVDDDPLDDVVFPSTVAHDDAEMAVIAAREYIKRDGPVTMREIVTTVMPHHPLGYDVPDLEAGDRYRGSWWRKVVKPGLKAYDDIEAPGEGESDWEYLGEDG